jgi:transposase-like protein
VPRTSSAYPPEFRREAIRLVRASDEEHPIPGIAREIGVSDGTQFRELGKPGRDRLRRARRAQNGGEGGTAQASSRGQDPPPGERDPGKAAAFFAREELGGR